MQDREIKTALRAELLRRRDKIPPEVRRTKDRIIHDQLFALDELMAAERIFFFASFRSEVDTVSMIHSALRLQKRAVLPKVNSEQGILSLHEIKDTDELSPGYMGIPEPDVVSGKRQFSIHDVDLVIIPGVGFDICGNRIGYGGGYYDILLSGLKRNISIIAPAYEEQIVDSISSEPHDVRVHIIVTDRRVIRCIE